MGSAFHQLCPRYSGTLTPTAPTAIRLWDTFTFTFFYSSLKRSTLPATAVRIFTLTSNLHKVTSFFDVTAVKTNVT